MTRTLALVMLAALTSAAAADPRDTRPGPPATQPPAARKPPAELTELAQRMIGAWKCEGTIEPPNMATARFKATLKTTLELGGFWIHETLEVDMAPPMKIEAYMTFDGARWHRTAFDSMGGQATGTANPVKDNKVEWAIENGGMLEKVHADFSDPKKGMHITAEQSMDKGTTWSKGPDIVCKK